MQLFKDIITIEQELGEDEGNLDLQTALARAREEYRWTKEYAIDTGADQVGLSDEEREAAEKAASGEAEVVEVVAEAPKKEDADRIQKALEEQRAKEQAAREEAIRIAEEESAAAAAESARL